MGRVDWVPTAGLAGQVFEGPASYVNSWDIAFQAELKRIGKLEKLAERRRALSELERAQGKAARRRMEAALQRIWNRKNGTLASR